MSRWIDADKLITVQLYDDMHEEWSVENMTIAECLDRYTEEGCPSAGRPKEEWIINAKDAINLMFTKPKCPNCGFESADGGNYCPNCGADMRGDKE